MVPIRKNMRVLAGVTLLAIAGGQAQADTAATIRQLQTLRQFNSLTIIDVAAMSEEGKRGKRNTLAAQRAANCNSPFTTLQAAIANNPALSRRVPNLRSVYAARVEGGRVYIYLGDPTC